MMPSGGIVVRKGKHLRTSIVKLFNVFCNIVVLYFQEILSFVKLKKKIPCE